MATKKSQYAYTIQEDVNQLLDDQSGDKFDPERKGAATIISQQPDRKAMRYVGTGDAENMDVTKAGAGRGKRGGPSAKEMGYKKGGTVSKASKRADGIAQRGKTRGKIY